MHNDTTGMIGNGIFGNAWALRGLDGSLNSKKGSFPQLDVPTRPWRSRSETGSWRVTGGWV